MQETDLQQLCERGQIELMETRYLDAADTLVTAEHAAWQMQSFDTLARLYLPLQEARRQIRQRCGEGAVRLHLFPASPDQKIDPARILNDCPTGQLLVAGWNTIAPAVELRQLAHERHLYIETFLASIEPTPGHNPLITIAPLPDWPRVENCLRLKSDQLPPDAPRGNANTFAGVMDLWEQLHTPFLQAAKNQPNPIDRMQAYRLTLQVDPACELAHQFLADIARHLARRQ